MTRIILFLTTNLSVMLLFGFILNLIGIPVHNIYSMIIISSILGFSGAFISLLFSKWIALKTVAGKVIEEPTNEIECWLIQTVKNQAQQMGISMPKVAIYEATDINAFATGSRRNSSLIAISSGLLQNVGKNETAAILAHEMSHIANGDMVTMTLIQGVVNTFVIFISRIIARIISNALCGQRGGGVAHHGNALVYTIISIILKIIFGIFASIITMWFSRHREFYADAGSAKIVGTEKMIAALKMLKTSSNPTESNSIKMQAFCINGGGSNRKWFNQLFMSHPSIDQRIQALLNHNYFSN